MPSTKRCTKGEGGLLSPLETGQLINGTPPCGTVDWLIVFSEGHRPPLPTGAGCIRRGRTNEGEPDYV
jgi:hypothetical protein